MCRAEGEITLDRLTRTRNLNEQDLRSIDAAKIIAIARTMFRSVRRLELHVEREQQHDISHRT
jgi:hypothetical protein